MHHNILDIVYLHQVDEHVFNYQLVDDDGNYLPAPVTRAFDCLALMDLISV